MSGGDGAPPRSGFTRLALELLVGDLADGLAAGRQKELYVQDPDGYLVMVAEPIGERPL